jgi:phosphoadenosine phosphosulfate reductase
MNEWNINTELDLHDFLASIAEAFGDKAAFSSSLSYEDQVVTHHIFAQNLPIRVFTLDTGRIFPETYAVLERTRERYGKSIELFFPDTLATQKLVSTKGPNSFYESLENRKECCHIRKIEPLNRALQNVDCWLTGLRAEHSENRSKLEIVEWDTQRQLHKVNPLANWTFDQVKAEIKKYNIPYNVLHDRGFVSIGCQPCTRSIKEGEDFRAGRWWWENSNKKECGLHE